MSDHSIGLYKSILRPETTLRDKEGLIHEVRRLFVTGTTGAFFAAFSHSIPTLIPRYYDSKIQGAFAEFILRCLFLIWFLGYFSTSYSQKKTGTTWWEIWFDVIQSISGLFAAYYMGFIKPDKYNVYDPIAYAAISGAIIVICFTSYLMFGKSARADDVGDIKGTTIDNFMNDLRGAAIVFALMLFIDAGALRCGCVSSYWFLIVSFIIYLLLLSVLWAFVRVTYLKK